MLLKHGSEQVPDPQVCCEAFSGVRIILALGKDEGADVLEFVY